MAENYNEITKQYVYSSTNRDTALAPAALQESATEPCASSQLPSSLPRAPSTSPPPNTMDSLKGCSSVSGIPPTPQSVPSPPLSPRRAPSSLANTRFRGAADVLADQPGPPLLVSTRYSSTNPPSVPKTRVPSSSPLRSLGEYNRTSPKLEPPPQKQPSPPPPPPPSQQKQMTSFDEDNKNMNTNTKSRSQPSPSPAQQHRPDAISHDAKIPSPRHPILDVYNNAFQHNGTYQERRRRSSSSSPPNTGKGRASLEWGAVQPPDSSQPTALAPLMNRVAAAANADAADAVRHDTATLMFRRRCIRACLSGMASSPTMMGSAVTQRGASRDQSPHTQADAFNDDVDMADEVNETGGKATPYSSYNPQREPSIEKHQRYLPSVADVSPGPRSSESMYVGSARNTLTPSSAAGTTRHISTPSAPAVNSNVAHINTTLAPSVVDYPHQHYYTHEDPTERVIMSEEGVGISTAIAEVLRKDVMISMRHQTMPHPTLTPVDKGAHLSRPVSASQHVSLHEVSPVVMGMVSREGEGIERSNANYRTYPAYFSQPAAVVGNADPFGGVRSPSQRHGLVRSLEPLQREFASDSGHCPADEDGTQFNPTASQVNILKHALDHNLLQHRSHQRNCYPSSGHLNAPPPHSHSPSVAVAPNAHSPPIYYSTNECRHCVKGEPVRYFSI